MTRRGLLLDRDGVINVDTGYVGHVEDFAFLPGIFPFARAAQDLGFRLAVLTNQAGVARGYYTAADFDKLNGWMIKEFAREGAAIDLVLGCFEHSAGTVPPYVRESFWRKPHPGMVLEAVQRMRLDPAHSAFLGDHPRDMQAAASGGIGTRLFLNAFKLPVPDGAVVVQGYDEALDTLSRIAGEGGAPSFTK